MHDRQSLSLVSTPWTLIEGEALAVLQSLPDNLADGIIADPPYSSGGLMRSDRQASPNEKYATQVEYLPYSGDNRDARSWLTWMTLWLTEAVRVGRPGSYILLFTDWRQLPAATDALQCGGAIWRGIIAWDKGPTARAPHTGYARHQCEYIVWGTIGPLAPAHGRGPFPGAYTIPIDPREKEHQAGKPIELMRKLARMIPPDGLILDPFAGSSSTGVGALLEDRRFLGIERESSFLDISRSRLERASAYRATLQGHPLTQPHPATPTTTNTQSIWRWRSKRAASKEIL